MSAAISRLVKTGLPVYTGPNQRKPKYFCLYCFRHSVPPTSDPAAPHNQSSFFMRPRDLWDHMVKESHFWFVNSLQVTLHQSVLQCQGLLPIPMVFLSELHNGSTIER